MNVSQRIRKIIDTKKITVKYFCERVDASRDAVNQMFRKETEPRLKLIENILREFPDINPYWLILGEGEMWVFDKTEAEGLEKEVRALKEKLEVIIKRLEKEL